MAVQLSDRGQIATINLVGTAIAGALTCVKSHHIKRPFRTLSFLVSFNLNQQRLVKHYFYISPDDSSVATLPDAGLDLLLEHSPHNFLVGDDQVKILHHQAVMETGSGFIKVYAQNDDVFDHDIDVQAMVEIF